MLHERQSEPEPAVGPRAGAVALPEALEDVRHELGVDADAGVGDHDLGPSRHAAQADADLARRRRELDRIGDQVPDDLLETVGIAEDRAGPRIEDGLDLDALGVGRRPHRVQRGLDHGHQIDRPRVEPKLAAHDA